MSSTALQQHGKCPVCACVKARATTALLCLGGTLLFAPVRGAVVVTRPPAIELLKLNAKVVQYLARHEARDKLCRIVAYGSDWVKWLLPLIGYERYLRQVANVKQGVGVGRKCFRVGVSLREVDTISKTTEVGFPRFMKITAHSCNGIYYLIDIFELLSIFEILPYKPANVKKIRYKVWTFKVVFSLCLILLAINKNKRAMMKEEREGKPDARKWAQLVASRRKLMSQLVMECTNVPIMLNIVTEWGSKNVGSPIAGSVFAISLPRRISCACLCDQDSMMVCFSHANVRVHASCMWCHW